VSLIRRKVKLIGGPGILNRVFDSLEGIEPLRTGMAVGRPIKLKARLVVL